MNLQNSNINIVFSVIIPFRGDVSLLKRLVLSIPDKEGVEVIIVDNNEIGISQDTFPDRNNITVYYSEFTKGAGNARNIGISYAKGKWLLFADADDFYHKGAFDVLYSFENSDADIIYFAVDSCYSDTLEPAYRGEPYSCLVGKYSENDDESQCLLRYRFTSPWAKMIRGSLIAENSILFEDIKAGNDIFFSIESGFYAKKVIACSKIVYCITYLEGSITTIKDIEYLKSGYLATIRTNKFLKTHGLHKYQHPIIFRILKARKYGWKNVFDFIKIAAQNRVSIFIGWKRFYGWMKRKIYQSITRNV